MEVLAPQSLFLACEGMGLIPSTHTVLSHLQQLGDLAKESRAGVLALPHAGCITLESWPSTNLMGQHSRADPVTEVWHW